MEAANNPRAISPFHPLVFQWRAADSSSSDYCKHSWGGGEGRESSLHRKEGRIETEDQIDSFFFFIFSFLFYPSRCEMFEVSYRSKIFFVSDFCLLINFLLAHIEPQDKFLSFIVLFLQKKKGIGKRCI